MWLYTSGPEKNKCNNRDVDIANNKFTIKNNDNEGNKEECNEKITEMLSE